MKINFEIKGSINAETLDDAHDIISLSLEDNGVTIERLDLDGKE